MLQQFDERNKDLLININGEMIHRDHAGISPFDSVVQGGDAVWEGLRLYKGRIFHLEEHLDRLHHSAKSLAFAEIPSQDYFIEEIKRTLSVNNMFDEVHIRLTLTRGVKITSGMDPRLNQSGPTLIVLAEFKKPVYDSSGISLITSAYRRATADVLDPKIHHNNLLNSILAKIQANAAGADDALMLDSHGFVAEANATHIFMIEDGKVVTSTTNACPEGITRAVILEFCNELSIPSEVRNISLAELHRSEGAFCSGTMGELTPVVKIDGITIGSGELHPLFHKLTNAFAELTATTGVVVVDS